MHRVTGVALVALWWLGCTAAPATPAPVRHRGPPAREMHPDPPARSRIQLGHADVWLEPVDGAPVLVRTEVAHTDALRRRGLMGRRYMARDAGMLFVFEAPRRQSFWMRNTFLSLDIIFIGADRRVVGVVERARPLSTDEQAVEGESQYVLEVHAGFASDHGITAGTVVRFENVTEE